MTESPYYENGRLITYGADGAISHVTDLNPQQLLRTEHTVELIEWLALNISEGNIWSTVDEAKQMSNANNHYNRPIWKAVAANGASFNMGELWYNLFERQPPTQSVIDELHKKAA